MATTTAQARAQELRAQIDRHNYLYYVLDSPEIADGQYDALLKDLRELEQAHPELVTPDSPTQRVGAEPAEGFEPVEHARPMLSLGNAFDEEEFYAWHRRVAALLERDDFELVCELKYDGLAVALTYEDGRLVQGSTQRQRHGRRKRDLQPAHDKKHTASAAGRQPALTAGGAWRGVLPQVAVLQVQRRARRTGRARLRQPAQHRGRLAATARPAARPPPVRSTCSSTRSATRSPPPCPKPTGTPCNFSKSLASRSAITTASCQRPSRPSTTTGSGSSGRMTLDVAADGVVVKVNRIDYQAHLGVVGREPRWAVAYKFPATQSVTRLLDVRFNVGRTGSINPYAVLEPVDIGGATVKQATLHNEDYVRSKDLLRRRLGDSRAGRRGDTSDSVRHGRTPQGLRGHAGVPRELPQMRPAHSAARRRGHVLLRQCLLSRAARPLG